MSQPSQLQQTSEYGDINANHKCSTNRWIYEENLLMIITTDIRI